MKEKDDNNCLLIGGKYKVERLNGIKEIKSQINELMDKKMKIINYSQQWTMHNFSKKQYKKIQK